MDWNEFVRRLAAELVRLPVDSYVIVQRPGGFPYVQAMRHSAGLTGEAVGDAFLREPQRLDLGRIQRMITLGWHEPDGRQRVNWWHDVALPAGLHGAGLHEAGLHEAGAEQLAECDHLAVRMVAALRDVYGVRSPADLEYRAARNGPGGGLLDLPGLGLEPAERLPLAAPAASGPGWAAFTERLAGELAGLDDGMVLVVYRADQDAYYVQAHRGPQRVRGEAVGNDVLDEPLRFPDADEKRLADAGWGNPGHPGPNWWVELPTGAPAAEYRRLAGMMVTALRDVQRAADPGDLRYEAFRGDIGIELTDFGIALAAPAAVSERRPARRLPAAELPAGLEPGPEPDLEKGLVAAKQRGDQRAYLALIEENGLIVPSTGRSDVVEFATTSLNDGLYVLTFTTAEEMSRALGGQAEHFRHVTVGQLAAEWPNPAWKLSINLGLPSEAYFDASVLTGVAATTEATETAETDVEPEPKPEPEAEPEPGPAVMQKVVPHPLVVHYLEGGYDRVAGYVHRVDDVAGLTTPELLVRGLRLTYQNSPFSAEDEAIHVIRWPEHKPALFKTPSGDGPPVREFKISSQRLPHGAEMYRIDRSGEVTRVAVFDADTRTWVGGDG